MNAINDNNDSFEDIFRDRFADFESEPSEILWNKIEPQLPVKPTRRFPYWQISALILGLFLGGIYFTRNDESLTETPAFASPNVPDKYSIIRKLSPKSYVELQKMVTIEEHSTSRNNSIVGLTFGKFSPNISMKNSQTKEAEQIISRNNSIVDLALEKFPAQKRTEKLFFTDSNNFSKNPLNPSNFQQSNPIITVNSIFEPNNKNLNVLNNLSNTFEPKSVSFINSQNISEQKINLSILDLKSYELLANNFKTAKLKFVTVPKEEVYFKERKPLEFYASAMPLLNYYTITPNGNDANFVHNISVNDDGDRIGFYTQAGLVFTLSDKFKLRTGLTFTKTNHSINYRVRTDSLVVQPADNKGIDVSFADLNKTYSQSANYLGTKVEVQYVFLRGEALTHYVSVGGEAAYRLNGNHELNGFANFAYGITRQIGDKAYLFIEPTFSYSLNQQSDNSSLLLVKPNKIGFNIGVNFKIK